MFRLWSRPWVVKTSERIMLLLPASPESSRRPAHGHVRAHRVGRNPSNASDLVRGARLNGLNESMSGRLTAPRTSAPPESGQHSAGAVVWYTGRSDFERQAVSPLLE